MHIPSRPAAIALAVVLALSLGGCIGVVGDTGVEERWVVDERFATEPVVVDDVAVAFVTPADDALQLRGWSIESGDALWSHDAVPFESGWPGTPMVVGEHGVLFMAPEGDAVRLQVVDPATGGLAEWTSLSLGAQATSWPSIGGFWSCNGVDDDAERCFSVPDPDEPGSSRYLMLSPTYGVQEAPLGERTGSLWRIGASVYVGEDGVVQRHAGRSRQWGVPTVDLLGFAPRAHHSLNAAAVPDGSVTVVWSNPAWGEDDVETSMHETTSAGVDAATGAVLWRHPGAPCVARTDVVVLCTTSGTWTPPATDDEEAETDVTASAIVAIDPRTGAERWAADVPETVLDVATDEAGWWQVSERAVLTATETDDAVAGLVVDVTTGETQTLDPALALPCTAESEATSAWRDAEIDVLAGVAWCDASLDPIEGAPRITGAVLAAAAVDAGQGRSLLLEEGRGLVAYEEP